MTISVDFYLAPKVRAQMATAQGHPFFSLARNAFEGIGCRVTIRADTEANRLASAVRPAYALFHFQDARHARALDVRRTAIGPFYRMEQAPLRGDYRLVDVPFVPGDIAADEAEKFFRIWERRVAKPAPDIGLRDYVFIPLQGRLLDHRSGQSMSPMDMIRSTMARDPARQIVIKLHPKESYSAGETDALRTLCIDPRVTIFEGDLNSALRHCAYVVTQNSSVLLKALFFRKPGIVFADCEYHHPFQSLRRGLSVPEAFARVIATPPAFEKFAYWYLQRECINTSRDWAGDRILMQARGFGWEV